MNLLTIFTPTYNREKKLFDTYLSLKNQTYKDFTWLIVDDGSSDNTEVEVEKWIIDSDFKIVYKKKKNGGKHSAYNYALNYFETKYVYLSLDSDDTIYSNDTIEIIIEELKKIDDEVGLVTLCSNSKDGNNEFVKKYAINELKNKSLEYAYTNNLFNAEGRMILLCDYVKKFKYPEIENERFFTEAYIYYQMNKKIKWTNLVTCYSEYLEDGLTANTNKLFVNNPCSWYLYNELRMKKNKNVLLKIKYAIYYISFGLLSNHKILKQGFGNIILVLLFPFGFLGAKYLKRKG